MTGLAWWLGSRRRCPDLPVAVITAHGNVESAVRALKLGAFDFVSKPLDLGVLRKLVAKAIKLADRGALSMAALASAAVAAQGSRLMGRSGAMDSLRELIARVSRSQAPVHITGESGTGKELVARLIHATGARHDAEFVPVNCGAIPSELMESGLRAQARQFHRRRRRQARPDPECGRWHLIPGRGR